MLSDDLRAPPTPHCFEAGRSRPPEGGNLLSSRQVIVCRFCHQGGLPCSSSAGRTRHCVGVLPAGHIVACGFCQQRTSLRAGSASRVHRVACGFCQQGIHSLFSSPHPPSLKGRASLFAPHHFVLTPLSSSRLQTPVSSEIQGGICRSVLQYNAPYAAQICSTRLHTPRSTRDHTPLRSPRLMHS